MWLSDCTIIAFFGATNPYKKIDGAQEQFLNILFYTFTKGTRPFQVVKMFGYEGQYYDNVNVIFPSHFDLVEKVILGMVKKPMNLHVFPNFKFGGTMFVNFDLWMSKGGVETFALAINHLNDSWTFMHVIIGSFEVHDTTWVSMAR